MRKLAFILALAVLASCTVRRDDTRERTATNIAGLAHSLCSIVGDDVVVKLSSTSEKRIFKDGLDTTMKTGTYNTGIKVVCPVAADSVLTVTNSAESSITFTATVSILGHDKYGQPVWKWKGNGKYDEKDDYSTLFESDSIKFFWSKYYYYSDYGLVDSVYVAQKTGNFRITTYCGTEELDWMQLTYHGLQGYSYHGSVED
ncbi:MAG: hypothetical protein J5771_05920 [Bacteroidales bacterium]|nr:hypothetical protein [Bacteroidales bacterium]